MQGSALQCGGRADIADVFPGPARIQMIEGQLHARECKITYRRDGQVLAVAVVHRDLEGLRAELQFEQAMAGRAPLIDEDFRQADTTRG